MRLRSTGSTPGQKSWLLRQDKTQWNQGPQLLAVPSHMWVAAYVIIFRWILIIVQKCSFNCYHCRWVMKTQVKTTVNRLSSSRCYFLTIGLRSQAFPCQHGLFGRKENFTSLGKQIHHLTDARYAFSLTTNHCSQLRVSIQNKSILKSSGVQ